MHLAFLGTGSIAERHLDAIQRTSDLEVVWLVSRSAGHAEGLALKKHIPRWSTNVNDVLRDANVDAVVIAYPTFLHEELALAAFAAGKHVVCEKPLSDSGASAERIAHAARVAGKLLLVAQLRRFWPPYDQLHHFARSGDAGSLVRATIDFQAEWDWSQRGWRVEHPGGYLLDMHVHEIDLLLWFFGTSPVSVWATGENRAEREGQVVIQFPTGYAVLSYCGRASGRTYPAGSLATYQLICTQGRAEASVTGEVHLEEWVAGVRHMDTRSPVGDVVRSSWDGMWGAFSRALHGAAPPPVDPEEAVANVRVACAALASMMSAQPIALARGA